MRQAGALGLAGALAIPGVAHAHAFASGGDAYGNFVDGTMVVLASPDLLLPVLALAVMLGLWHRDGILKAWPYAFLGSVAGIAAAPLAGPWVAGATLGIGAVLAVLAALVPLARISPAIPVLAALAALVTLATALEGHAYAEIPHATRLGLLFGFHFMLAAVAGLVRYTRDQIDHPATTIGWRVVASWLAAILVLYVAFSFSAPAT